ncbi:MAG: YCF48-related protein [Azoarcus sp.]|jgi:photosystem II stability/assembly factor-like uncharacterized protein|nr:YCF48-related protein [Azoarcus sp.]MDX9837175.1 YCF48-related protein [Azoarcus sp.]
MDRIPDQVAAPAAGPIPSPPSAEKSSTSTRSKLLRAPVAIAPWLIIGGLLWAGLFIKPQPVGKTVQPPILERRDSFYGIALAANGEVWIAGSSGKILSLNGEGGITRLTTPTKRTLQDLATWSDGHGIAVGNDGVILHSADKGQTWLAADNVPRSEIANKLNRVRVAPDGMTIATGEMGALLMSRDYGSSWTRLREEEDVAWNDVAIIDDSRIRVVGEFGRILLSDDGGSTWTELEAPVASSLMSVAFRDAEHGVAVGLEGVVLTTSDGGLSWQEVELPVRDHLLDIAWDEGAQRWIGTGNLGRWVQSDADAVDWQTGRLDERDLSWHTRVLPAGDITWFAGANVGRWDGKRWMPIGN